VVFWDAETGAKQAVADCDDKTLRNGELTLLAQRKQMLVKFDNGIGILDLSARKWGKTQRITDIISASASPDEKLISVTSRDQSVKVLDIDSGKALASWKEQPINMTPGEDGGAYEYGPAAAQFVDDGKALRVLLNDSRTVVYRDVKTGARIKTPASEVSKFPGNVRVLAVSSDRRLAVTTTLQSGENCTIWQRDVVKKK
jgi:WD40 repeat protein